MNSRACLVSCGDGREACIAGMPTGTPIPTGVSLTSREEVEATGLLSYRSVLPYFNG